MYSIDAHTCYMCTQRYTHTLHRCTHMLHVHTQIHTHTHSTDARTCYMCIHRYTHIHTYYMCTDIHTYIHTYSTCADTLHRHIHTT